LQEPPITVMKKINGILMLEGFFGEVWHVLEQKMNFT
jgi:hypothetical protein